MPGRSKITQAKLLEELDNLVSVPWATWGRRESFDELKRHWSQQSSRGTFFLNPVSFHWMLDAREADLQTTLRTITSIRAQSYANWKLAVIGSEALWEAVCDLDSRIHRINSVEGFAKEISNQEFVSTVDPGDVVSPVAGYLFAVELNKHPEATWIQSNEAIFDPVTSSLSGVIQRRTVNLFDLMQFDCAGRLWAVRADTVSDWSLWPNERAFLLQYFSQPRATVSCSSVLYYRHQAGFDPSLSRGGSAEVLQQYLDQSGFPGDVVAVNTPFGKRPRVRAKMTSALKVSAIICFRDRSELMQECLSGLEHAARDLPIEVFLVDNGSQASERKKVEEMCKRSALNTRILDFPYGFNFAAMNNLAAKQASGDVLLLLNNDVFLNPTIDLSEWVAWASQPDSGTVGILLRFPNGKIQHAGMRAYFGGEARMVRVGNLQSEDPIAAHTREVFANTFAAVMVRRSVYEEVGGLRELEMVNGFGDLVFNFDCLKRGYRNRFLGHLEAIHHEGASRGIEFEYWEERSLEGEYPELLTKMLREDHGWNRTPAGDLRLKTMLWQWAKLTARERELLDWFSEGGWDPAKVVRTGAKLLSAGLGGTKSLFKLPLGKLSQNLPVD